MKNKIKIIFNILKNYSKYRKLVGTKVLIVENKDLEKYNNYIGRTGVVYGFQFDNTKNPFIIRFTTGEELCFNSKEFRADKQIRKDASKRIEDIYDTNKVPTYDELLKENKRLKQKYLDAVADYETEKSKNAAAIKILNRDVILDVEEDISEFLNRWMEETLQTLKGDTTNNDR